MSEATTIERPRIAPRASRPATGTVTVVVGLKHPSGLILQGFKKKKVNVATPMGFREEEIYDRVGNPFPLKGNAQMLDLHHRLGMQFDSGGYAITPGVPADLWEQWLTFNIDSPLVTEELIFAEDDEASARAHGRELAKKRSGLEAIDPEHPELHLPKGKNKNVSAIQQSDAR